MSHLLKVDEKRDLGPTPTWYIFLKKTTVYIINGPKIHHVISSVYSQNVSRVRKFPYDFIGDLGPTPTWYIFLKKTTVDIINRPKIHNVISSDYSQNISRVRKNSI